MSDQCVHIKHSSASISPLRPLISHTESLDSSKLCLYFTNTLFQQNNNRAGSVMCSDRVSVVTVSLLISCQLGATEDANSTQDIYVVFFISHAVHGN